MLLPIASQRSGIIVFTKLLTSTDTPAAITESKASISLGDSSASWA